jgi:hypothetical protein
VNLTVYQLFFIAYVLGMNLKGVPKNPKALAGGRQSSSMFTPNKKIGELDIAHYILCSNPYELFNIQKRKLISMCAFQVRTWSYIVVRIIDEDF